MTRVKTVKTPHGLLRKGPLSDEWQLQCPGCGQWAYIDDDQYHGRVSVDHTNEGCTYHETHDFSARLRDTGASDEQ